MDGSGDSGLGISSTSNTECTVDIISNNGVAGVENVTELTRELDEVSIFPENKGCSTLKHDSLQVFDEICRGQRLSEESEETNLPRVLEQVTNPTRMNSITSAQIWPLPVPLENKQVMVEDENFLKHLSELHLSNIQKLEEWKPGGKGVQDAAIQDVIEADPKVGKFIYLGEHHPYLFCKKALFEEGSSNRYLLHKSQLHPLSLVGKLQDAEELSVETLKDALNGLQSELNQEANHDQFWSGTKLDVSEFCVSPNPPTPAPASIECSVIKVNTAFRCKTNGNKEVRDETVFTAQDENDENYEDEESNHSPSLLSVPTGRPSEFSILEDSLEPEVVPCESQPHHGHPMNPGSAGLRHFPVTLQARSLDTFTSKKTCSNASQTDWSLQPSQSFVFIATSQCEDGGSTTIFNASLPRENSETETDEGDLDVSLDKATSIPEILGADNDFVLDNHKYILSDNTEALLGIQSVDGNEAEGLLSGNKFFINQDVCNQGLSEVNEPYNMPLSDTDQMGFNEESLAELSFDRIIYQETGSDSRHFDNFVTDMDVDLIKNLRTPQVEGNCKDDEVTKDHYGMEIHGHSSTAGESCLPRTAESPSKRCKYGVTFQDYLTIPDQVKVQDGQFTVSQDFDEIGNVSQEMFSNFNHIDSFDAKLDKSDGREGAVKRLQSIELRQTVPSLPDDQTSQDR